MDYAIAVIDIGMTNKKVAVYDDRLNQIDARYRIFPPLMIRGLECHDLAAMESWFIAELRDLGRQYPIRAIAVTVHGATFICVGKDGTAALPCILYTHEPGEDFHRRFYERFGEPNALQERTGTPAFKAMINNAKCMMFSQETFPAEFKNTARILPFPQYWGFRFTGKFGAECTYMGNHSYLWDQIDHTPSSVARDLGIAELLPQKLHNSWDELGTITNEFAEKTGLPPSTIVTMGIHDSNSSLLPHFAKKGETGFVLNSTGTWCVLMNPVKEYGFAPGELGKVVLFNISAFGSPVKTAIFLGGQEFEIWSKLLMKLHQREDFPSWNESLYRTILKDRQLFLLPELTPGSGQFPDSKARVTEGGRDYLFADIEKAAVPGAPGTSPPGAKLPSGLPPCFADYDTAFAILRISLVMQTLTSLERAGMYSGAEVYTEGGFRKNESYNVLLSSALENRVFLTDIAEATALGAAMTAKMALSRKKLSDLAADFDVEYREVEKKDIPELFPYREAWMAMADKT